MSMTEKEFQELLKNNPKIKEKLQEKQKKEKQEKKAKEQPNKYHNIKVYEYASGIVTSAMLENDKIVAVYDSIKEYNRWCELLLMQKAGQIHDLERQVAILIQEAFSYHGEKIRKIDYVADFMYEENGQTVVEDVKPLDPKTSRYRFTKDFVLKWKLLKAKYPNYIFLIY